MIYSLCAPDNRHDDWLFSEPDLNEILRLKLTVKPYACPKCGKFPEERVINEVGMDLNFYSNNKAKAFSSLDDWIIVEASLSRKLSEHQVRSVPVNRDSSLFALMPYEVEIDLNKAGFEYSGKHCPKCIRPHEAVVGPLIRSHILPNPLPFMWTTKIHNESIKGARLDIWFGEGSKKTIMEMFDSNFEYLKAL